MTVHELALLTEIGNKLELILRMQSHLDMRIATLESGLLLAKGSFCSKGSMASPDLGV